MDQRASFYRLDIQMLRGISVLLVVLFHMNITFFGSGFLGVDVFFVISGFLMAILYKGTDIKGFFTKRALRLLPAYYVVILAVVLIGFLLTTPNEYRQIVDQALFASGFLSNIGFWLDNSYFSKEEYTPLLHLWSLGVEIQFYVILPLFYFFLRHFKFLSIIGLLISFALTVFMLSVSHKTAFFMMPLRFWEFMVGYIVAQFLTNAGNVKSDRWSSIGALAFIGLIILAFMELDGEASGYWQGHPGLNATLISLATGIVLVCGLPTALINSKIGKSLSKVGEYSYSLYLVHYPIIVLYLYEPFSGTILSPTYWGDYAVLTILITLSTLLLYHLVENKFRKKPINLKLFVVVSFAICLIAVASKHIQLKTITPAELKIANAFLDRDTYRCGKIFRLFNPKSLTCPLTEGETETTQTILLVGNSHADAIKKTFAQLAEKHDTAVYFMVPNNPLLHDSNLTPADILDEATDRKAEKIVLHYSPNSFNPEVMLDVATLAEKQNIKVDFIMPIPVWETLEAKPKKLHVPKMLWNKLKHQEALPQRILKDYMKIHKNLYATLNGYTGKNLRVYDVAGLFCNNNCAMADQNGSPLYFDDGHLTLTGSKVLTPVLKQILLR